jgi:TolA-binding protein
LLEPTVLSDDLSADASAADEDQGGGSGGVLRSIAFLVAMAALGSGLAQAWWYVGGAAGLSDRFGLAASQPAPGGGAAKPASAEKAAAGDEDAVARELAALRANVGQISALQQQLAASVASLQAAQQELRGAQEQLRATQEQLRTAQQQLRQQGLPTQTGWFNAAALSFRRPGQPNVFGASQPASAARAAVPNPNGPRRDATAPAAPPRPITPPAPRP